VKLKTVLVTGANSGIGFETAAGLADMGARVVMTARDAQKGEDAVARVRERSPDADVEWMELDLASLRNVRVFAAAFNERVDKLNVLVNNAGLIFDRRVLTEDGFEMTFQVNHLGPFLLTNLLLDKLKASRPSRIVNVSSVTHRGALLDFDDLQGERSFGGMRAYGKSKLCNILFTRELARRLDGTGVTSNALHPGTVRTGFSGGGDTGLLNLGWRIGGIFFKSPKKGAETSIYLASSYDVEAVSGEYFVKKRIAQASAAAMNDETARRLWDVSADLAGL
jgi:retinol dehydrogenase 12